MLLFDITFKFWKKIFIISKRFNLEIDSKLFFLSINIVFIIEIIMKRQF